MSDTQAFVSKIEAHDVVQSTMQIAAARAAEGAAAGTTIVAAGQHDGRGRKGNRWYAPTGGGVWMTTLLRPESSAPQSLTLIAGLAVVEAVEQWVSGPGATGTTGDRLGLKWPNDVLFGKRKLAGILVEAISQAPHPPVLLVGIGVNTAAADTLGLPDDVLQHSVGMTDVLRLSDANAAAPVPMRVAEAIVARLEKHYKRWCDDGLAPFTEAWGRYDTLKGLAITAEGKHGPVAGIAQGIDATGRLRIDVDGSMVAIDAGEVHVVRS